MRHQTLERLKQSGKDRSNPFETLGPMGPLNTELLAEMNERVEILMEENALIVEQKVSKGLFIFGLVLMTLILLSLLWLILFMLFVHFVFVVVV